MKATYRRNRRFKPGRYILLLLVAGAFFYNFNVAADEEQPVSLPPAVNASVISEATTSSHDVKPAVDAQPQPVVLVAQVESTPGGNELEKKAARPFGMMDELAALESINIVAIEELNLDHRGSDFIINSNLVFLNENIFPVHIVHGNLDATLVLNEGGALRLGKIRLQDILLADINSESYGITSTDVLVMHGSSIENILGAISGTDWEGESQGTLNLPLLVSGELSVEIQLVGGLSVSRTFELDFEYQPKISTELLAAFKRSLQGVKTSRLQKG